MLTDAQKELAVSTALDFIASSPTGNLREYLQTWMLSAFAEPGRSEYWGEATDVCLVQEVLDASRAAIINDTVQKAFAADKQSALDTIDSGSSQTNPWVLFDSAKRKAELAERMKVIALSNGGNGTETCPPCDIGYSEAHTLAVDGRAWLLQGKTRADAETLPNSDDVFYMRLAFKYMDLEDAAIANGTFKSPAEIQRSIAEAKYYADPANQP